MIGTGPQQVDYSGKSSRCMTTRDALNRRILCIIFSYSSEPFAIFRSFKPKFLFSTLASAESRMWRASQTPHLSKPLVIQSCPQPRRINAPNSCGIKIVYGVRYAVSNGENYLNHRVFFLSSLSCVGHLNATRLHMPCCQACGQRNGDI